ncbi:MAG TPA: trypsin-like peptidase domain-containing protein [Intrasporangium sp.]|uniref:S1C family serine protease n=1 Tax=Intrasporangium sp. TaxID=1925024 RepID=UPI002D799049|nr:trypsin-like peptidase domain-containing protein [Intrasporangium sp.]HET7398792.1 trypsin-like peptidase domain-containing protein [Intrasporangium sp.]
MTLAPDSQYPATQPTEGPSAPPPSHPAGPPGRAPRERRRLAETTGVALLAAVLASGGTYAVTQGQGRGTAAPAGTTTPVAATTSAPGNSSPVVVQATGSAPDWSAVAKAVTPSVVSIDMETASGSGAGSGVIFDAQGHVLTNNHVVAGATSGSLTVTLADGRSYAASIVGTDPSTDLAVIKLKGAPADLTPITLGSSDALTVGAPVMAVGNPLGLSGTVTTGIVSALDRPVSTSTSEERQSPFGGQATSDTVVTNAIQTSAAINPGNSGGALVNAKGELIGINSSIAQLGGGLGGQSGNIGIGFAIPVTEAKAIATQLISKGHADHAFLGVSTRDATVTDGSAKRAGAQVSAVSSGTPAASAGIKEGDVIIAVDGQRVDSATALVAQVRERTAGSKVKITLVRGGTRQDVEVTLAVKPTTTATP